ncbi:hypothetical protein K402DRAFT_395917 [Aulographum hederae CBS 113979]|uniref:Defect at low temperature protein 1 n=1 Tax=Aulographum hederae CBS 113979 TaxID=1176131 RepID=A0A6G1GTZ1_9PEZI|nr:hypothetical protein K402DRAFT_395917 [Aulographum hederae CBS 113979]
MRLPHIPHPRHWRIPYFRIWYSTTYTIIFTICIILLAATPGDTIYQSVQDRNIPNVFVVAGTYLVTSIICVLVYATRIYTNKSVLATIPKAYVPVEQGEVGAGVRKMIVREWERSALVAWDSRPRDLRSEIEAAANSKRKHRRHFRHHHYEDEHDIGDIPDANIEEEVSPHKEKEKEKDNGKENEKDKLHHSIFHKRLPPTADLATAIKLSPTLPPWGPISHPGWSSPSIPDLPHLHYRPIILELPNLIEAKAVSLAPADDAVISLHLSPPLLSDDGEEVEGGGRPDTRVVAVLQRPSTMGVRDYLARLVGYGLVTPPTLAARFLTRYERARFSGSPVTEDEFRELMAVFGDILAGMTTLSAGLLADLQDGDDDGDGDGSVFLQTSEEESDASAIHHYPPPQLPLGHPYASSTTTTTSTSDDGGSISLPKNQNQNHNHSHNHTSNSIPARPPAPPHRTSSTATVRTARTAYSHLPSFTFSHRNSQRSQRRGFTSPSAPAAAASSPSGPDFASPSLPSPSSSSSSSFRSFTFPRRDGDGDGGEGSENRNLRLARSRTGSSRSGNRSLRSAGSLIRLTPRPSPGEAPYRIVFGEG